VNNRLLCESAEKPETAPLSFVQTALALQAEKAGLFFCHAWLPLAGGVGIAY